MARKAKRSDVQEFIKALGHDCDNVYEVVIKCDRVIVSSFSRNTQGDIRLDALGAPITRDSYHFYAGDEDVVRSPADGFGA